MNERIIIKNGCVVTMNDANDVLFDGAVVLEGDRITDVGPTADVLARQSADGARVIDASGKAVLPGAATCAQEERSGLAAVATSAPAAAFRNPRR